MKVPLNDLRRAALRDRDALADVLSRVADSGWYILGAEVQRFEAAFAGYIGASHAVGVGNGTDAIELALRALDVGAGTAGAHGGQRRHVLDDGDPPARRPARLCRRRRRDDEPGSVGARSRGDPGDGGGDRHAPLRPAGRRRAHRGVVRGARAAAGRGLRAGARRAPTAAAPRALSARWAASASTRRRTWARSAMPAPW